MVFPRRHGCHIGAGSSFRFRLIETWVLAHEERCHARQATLETAEFTFSIDTILAIATGFNGHAAAVTVMLTHGCFPFFLFGLRVTESS